jgi:DNA-binding NarL/FixJ family response regulator
MTRSRIVLADDQTLLLEALARLLDPEFDVVATCANGLELLEVAARVRPDAVVLDVAMPLLNGLDAGGQLLKALPSVKLVYLTANKDPALAAEALRLGASAYVLKTSSGSELAKAIHGALCGRSYVTPLVAERLAGAFIRNGTVTPRPVRLTARQREVLQLLAEGRLMKEIAAILRITPRTVAFHKYAMMDELQIRTNAELIRYAIKSAAVSA